MARQYYEEWPDDMRRQDYPFVDGATRTDTGREMTIEREWLVDGRLWPATYSSRVHLRQIERSSAGLVLQINDLDGQLMTAFVSLGALGSTTKLPFTQGGIRRGFLKFAPGALQRIYDHPSGTYRFTPSATEFASTVVSPSSAEGVTSFVVGEDRLSGDVLFFGGQGVELDSSGSTLAINMVGDPYFRREQCEDAEFLGKMINPLRRLVVTDLQTSRRVEIVPSAGTLLTTVEEDEGRQVQIEGRSPRHPLAYHAPGPNGEILYGVVQ